MALEEFKGMVTLAGTVRPGALESNPTTSGPVAAGALAFTEQEVVLEEPREAAAQLREVTVTGRATVITPPVAAMSMALPAGDAPKIRVRPMEIEPAFKPSPTVTTAMLPSTIVLAFRPVARQV